MQLILHLGLKRVSWSLERQITAITETVARHVPVIASKKTKMSKLLVLFDVLKFVRKQRHRAKALGALGVATKEYKRLEGERALT